MDFVHKTVRPEGLLTGDIKDIEVDQVLSGHSVRLSYTDYGGSAIPYQVAVYSADDDIPNMAEGDISVIHRNLLVHLKVVE